MLIIIQSFFLFLLYSHAKIPIIIVEKHHLLVDVNDLKAQISIFHSKPNATLSKMFAVKLPIMGQNPYVEKIVLTKVSPDKEVLLVFFHQGHVRNAESKMCYFIIYNSQNNLYTGAAGPNYQNKFYELKDLDHDGTKEIIFKLSHSQAPLIYNF